MQHPDYDIEFKPAIARYDWDQTYDVLEFVHLPQGFDGLMDSLGIPAFELMAIDRYTPYNYLWAEEYSDYVYNFLKQFNFSPHNSIVERLLRDESNALIKDSNNNNITVPAFVFSGEKYSKTAEYKVTLTEGKYEITGLVYQGWKDGIIGSIPTINQASYRFTLSETTEIDLNQIINHWCKDDLEGDSQFCINSLVLSKLNGCQWQSVAVDATKFLFYQDIAEYWGDVSQELLDYFSQNIIIEYINQHSTTSLPIQSYIKKIQKPYKVEKGNPTLGQSVNTDIYFSQLQLSSFPLLSVLEKTVLEFEKYPLYLINLCYLCRANNNKWGSNLYFDLGFQQPQPDINNSFLNRNIYNIISEQNSLNLGTFNQIILYTNKASEYLLDWNYNSDSNELPDLITESLFWKNNILVNNISTSGGFPSSIENTYFQDSFPNTNLPLNIENTNVTNKPILSTITSNENLIANNTYAFWSFTKCYNLFLPLEQQRPLNSLVTFSNTLTNFFPNVPYLKYVKKTHYPSQIVEVQLPNCLIGTTDDYSSYYIYSRLLAIYTSEVCYGIKTFLPSMPTYTREVILNYTLKGLTDTNTWLLSWGDLPTNWGDMTIEGNNAVMFWSGIANGQITPTETSLFNRTPYYELVLFTQQEWEELYSYNAVSDEEYLAYLQDLRIQQEAFMVDSVRIKEIHACLGAGEASYYNDSQGNPREVVMNIARKLDLLCKWQGLSVKMNGQYNRSQSSKYFPPGRPIPPGWYYDRTGVNAGFYEDSEMFKEATAPLSIDDQRVGIAYQVRSNLGVETDEGLEIVKGGTVLCNNILQYLDTIVDDFAKGLDLEELGTGAITVGDKTFIYEGILDILQEILFLVSDNNNNTEESKIAIGVTQQVSKEILKALGLPYGVKTFSYRIEGQGVDDVLDGKPIKRLNAEVPYPGTIFGAPTLVDLLLAILANQGIANISQINLKDSKIEELLKQE